LLDQAASETTMTASRENRAARPTGPRAGHPTAKADPTVRADGGAGPTLIHVQCPNPACGKSYTIRSTCAGKNGKCSCETVFPIPAAGADDHAPAAHGQPHHEDLRPAAGEEVDLRAGDDVMKV